jgi:hypothetical protein
MSIVGFVLGLLAGWAAAAAAKGRKPVPAPAVRPRRR